MIGTLKAIGIPVTAAAVISALVVTIPLLFQIDERYAKEEDLRTEVAALKLTNDQLQRELAQLAGFQQAMTQFISEGRIPRHTAPVVTPPPAPVIAPVETAPTPEPAAQPASAPAVVPQSFEKPNNWRELNDGLVRQQQRLVIPRD